MKYVEIEWENGAVKYSRHALQFTDHQSEAILTARPGLTRSLLYNYGIENSTFTFELWNSPKIVQQIENDTILGTRVKYYNEGDCLYTGYICEFPRTKPGKNITAFKADIFYRLNSPVNKVIDEDEFPNAGENLGKYCNIIIGNETAGMYEARQVEPGKYLAAWNELSVITAAQTKSGTDILPEITKEIDPVKGYTYILYNSTEDTIYFNGKGPESSGVLIENPAMMLNYLLANFSEFSAEGFSEAEGIYDGREYNGNFLFITDESTWIDIFKNYSQSYNCRVIYTKEGKVKIKLIKWNDETPLFSLEETTIKNFQKRKETKYLKKSLTRKYRYNPQNKKYQKTPMDLKPEKSYSEQTGELPQKYLIDEVVSWDVGTRHNYMIGKPIVFYSIEIPESFFMQCELGDTVGIRHRDSYFPGQERLVQILRIQSIMGSGFYQIEGNDINEIKGTSFIIRDEGDARNPVLYEAGNNRNPKIWWSN